MALTKIVISKLDEDSYLIELDNIVSQPFNKNSWKDMLLFINAHIKKLECKDMFKAIDEFKLP